MAFGKKKNQISNKVTQTHRISVDGLMDIQPDGRIFVEVEDVGAVALSKVLADMDGRMISLSASSKQEDYLTVDLSDDEDDDQIDVLDVSDFEEE